MNTGTDSEKKRVFIVDDHPRVGGRLAALINQQPGLEVCGDADNSSDALRLIGALKPHLVLLDLATGGKLGLELMKKIKTTWPDLVVMVLSTHDELNQRAGRGRTRGHALKKDAARKVLRAIRCVLDAKLFLASEIAGAPNGKTVEDGPLAPGFPVDLISRQELKVFKLLGRGYTTSKIAGELQMTVSGVQALCARIKEKLMLAGGAQLRREAKLWHNRHKLKGSARSR